MNFLNSSDVCTKYQEAAKIVNLTLEGLIGQCIPGAKVLDLSEFGHTVMEAQAAKLYTKKVDGKAIDRGVAFPICISVNDIVCNHSPLPTEEAVGHFCSLLDLNSCLPWKRKIAPVQVAIPSGPRARPYCPLDDAISVVLYGEGVPRLEHRLSTAGRTNLERPL